jgi:ubiquinone/menaquinone biosynthesis C-methylase UbiE
MPKTQPFDENTFEYEEWFAKNQSAYESELQAVRGMLPHGGRGLEIGVGTGNFAVPLGIKLGIEPSRSMGEVARNKGIRVSSGIAEALPVSDGCLDFVLMVTVLCFFNDVPAALGEVHRVLKDGGSVVIAFIDRNSPLGRKYDEGKEESLFYQDASFLSADEVASHLADAGFRDIRFVQTIFTSYKGSDEVQPVREGHGEGVFAVVRAEKQV